MGPGTQLTHELRIPSFQEAHRGPRGECGRHWERGALGMKKEGLWPGGSGEGEEGRGRERKRTGRECVRTADRKDKVSFHPSQPGSILGPGRSGPRRQSPRIQASGLGDLVESRSLSDNEPMSFVWPNIRPMFFQSRSVATCLF